MDLNFYDQFGKPYAYSADGQVIHTFGGAPIAYFDGDSIYCLDGRHAGYFQGGVVLDPQGNTLLFTDGATGGPAKPRYPAKPMKGLKRTPPMKGAKQMKPARPMPSINWSQLAPQTVFGA